MNAEPKYKIPELISSEIPKSIKNVLTFFHEVEEAAIDINKGLKGFESFPQEIRDGIIKTVSEIAEALSYIYKDVELSKGISPEDVENEALRLAYLKENFKYQDKFKELKGYFQSEDKLPFNEFKRHLSLLYEFGICSPFSLTLRLYSLTNANILKLFDPASNPLEEKERNLLCCLPFIFKKIGVIQIVMDDDSYPRTAEGEAFEYFRNIKKLKPSERLYKVDLSVSKSQVLKEIGGFIDSADAFRKISRDKLFKNKEISAVLYQEDEKFITGKLAHRLSIAKESLLEEHENFVDSYQWETDNTRQRKEAFQHLKVWRLRRLRYNWKEIASELDITEGAAKMSYRRAYESTQLKPYKHEKFNRIPLSKDKFQTLCDTCPHRETCDTLCPDAIRYAEQEHGAQQEKLLSEDTDSMKDYLSSKFSF